MGWGKRHRCGCNVNLGPELLRKGTPFQVITLSPAPFLTDMNMDMGAGFYTSVFGALPFALGNVPDEKYISALFK